MTYGRRRSRKDEAEDDIVKALERVGCEVWVIERPVDLLTLYRGRWLPLEVKTGKYRPDPRQIQQTETIQKHKIPVVTTPLEALRAIGAASL